MAGERGRVTLWHARTLAPAGELRGLPADSQALAFSPDGRLLAAAVNTGDPLLRVWNVPQRAPTAVSKTVAASLAFSPDGELFAAAALDRGTEIRDAQTARLVERVPAEGLSRSVAFSPDGRLLAVGQFDGVGQLYSTDGWEPLGGPLEGHTQRITYVAFSPDGGTLATASADGTVKLWDVGTQQPIGPPLTVEPDTFASAAFSPNSAHLFAASTRGPGFRFDTDPRAWSGHACTVARRPDLRAVGGDRARAGLRIRLSVRLTPRVSRPSSGRGRVTAGRAWARPASSGSRADRACRPRPPIRRARTSRAAARASGAHRRSP